MDLVELMIYPIVTNYLSVISRHRMYQILSYLLHESFPSNFVLLNFVKNFRNICLKKYRVYQKSNEFFSYVFENCPSDIVNFEKIFKNYVDFLLNHWKFLKIVQKFDNFWWRHHWSNPPPLSIINRNHLETPLSLGDDVICDDVICARTPWRW